MAKRKMTKNNDLQNIHIKLKIEQRKSTKISVVALVLLAALYHTFLFLVYIDTINNNIATMIYPLLADLINVHLYLLY